MYMGQECDTILNHTGVQQRFGKVLVNLALPMFTKPEGTSPGTILQYYREKNGVSKAELAEKLGMTEYGVINLEKGFNPIHYKDAVAAGELLNLDPEELLDEYTRFCKPGYGKRIKKIRAAYGVSQKAFSELAGVNRSTVSIWEAEINDLHPSRDTYRKLMVIAAEKGVDFDDA